RPVAGEAGEIVLGQPGVVLFRAEQVGGEVVGGEEGGEVVPDERAVADERLDGPAVFACLLDDESGRGRALDMTMQFRLEDHPRLPYRIPAGCAPSSRQRT